MPSSSKSSSSMDRHQSPMTEPEAAILLAISLAGIATNTLVFIVILSKKSLRKPSMGLIAHHCVVDLIKSALSIPYSLNAYKFDGNPPPHCDLLGALYVVLVTVSFLNVLCMVLNDSPTFPDKQNEMLDSHQCVIFGLCMIWFTGCIINVGSFLTGTPGFNKEIGNCGIVYGPIRSYVTNILWVAFNLFTMSITGYQLRKLYNDLTASTNMEAVKLVSLVTTMLSVNSTSRENAEHRRVRRYIQELEHEGLIRLRLFALLLLLLFLQWVPLFTLTIVDVQYTYTRIAYKVCIQLAYSNACINPIILLVTYKNLRSGVRTLFSCKCTEEEEEDGHGACGIEMGGKNRKNCSRTQRRRAAADAPSAPTSVHFCVCEEDARTTANTLTLNHSSNNSCGEGSSINGCGEVSSNNSGDGSTTINNYSASNSNNIST